jgi:hypothetical protein
MEHGAQTKSRLAAALAALSIAHPATHSARMEELGYLANVLMAGCKHEGRKLRPVEALEAAIATCGLGLDLWEQAERAITVELDAQLLQQLGCDHLFRTAWSALQRDLVQPARLTLGQRCASLDSETGLQAEKLLREGAAFELRSVCRASALDLRDEAFDTLLRLAETLPWHVSGESRADLQRWIASSGDLERARRRLAMLAL